MDSKYLDIKKVPVNPDKKTDVYYVYPKDKPMKIAEIKWYAPWRKYCFYAEPETIFDLDCLKEITFFLTKLTLDRKLAIQSANQNK